MTSAPGDQEAHALRVPGLHRIMDLARASRGGEQEKDGEKPDWKCLHDTEC